MSPELPLLSSRQIVNALQRAGFSARRKSRAGSHTAFVGTWNGRKRTVVVVLGKPEVPRGTLRSIIEEQAGMTIEEFLSFVR